MPFLTKAKICKRVGANIFGSPKYDKIMARSQERQAASRKNRKKETNYGRQLREKQLARYMFGVSEKQFRLYYDRATKEAGITGNNLVRLLERRLDNVVFRAGFAKTRPAARQMVSHANFMLNGRPVTIPSILIKEGDVVELRARLQKSPLFTEITGAEVNWIDTDAKHFKATIKNLPDDESLEKMINSQVIVEFYSR